MAAAQESTTGDVPLTQAKRRLGPAAWAVLLGGCAVLLLSAAQATYRLALPTDGWSYTSGAIGGPFEDHIFCCSP